ncbi:ABC transporter permease subunit [Nonomuraea sp. NPDC049486]|uniref:ABC transporter permease n=1 Tax=Nonomuraea sp. NPDC049486 TaxID=3155773 RepID=UPI003445173C
MARVEPITTQEQRRSPATGRRRRARSERSPRWLWLVLLLVGVPTILPVAYVLISSFNDASPGQTPVWSLAPWERVFDSATTVDSLVVSLILSLRVPISLGIAFLLSWMLVRFDVPGKGFIHSSLWFAFFLPVLPMTFGWQLLLDPGYGLVNQLLMKLPFVTGPVFDLGSIPGIMFIYLTLATVPIMAILVTPAMEALDSSYEDASAVAGAGGFTTLRRITMPLLTPALLVAFLAGFIKSLETFEVEELLGTPAHLFVYSTRIYDLLRANPADYPQAMALSSVLLVLLFAVALVYRRVLARRADISTLSGKAAGIRIRPRTPLVWAGTIVIYLSIALFLVLPFGMLIAGSFTRLFGFFFLPSPWTTRHWTQVFTSDDFAGAMWNSIWVSLIVAVVGTVIYTLLGILFTRRRGRVVSVISVVSWLPYAIPGLLIGTAFLTIALMTPLLTRFLTTLLPLILVLIVQAMPLGSQMMSTSVQQLSRDLEDASSVSGASWLTTLRRVVVPLVSPMMMPVFAITFMTAMKDISATVLLASPGTNTLSLLMFKFATSSSQESAAVVGVLIAGMAFLTSLLTRMVGARLQVK